MKSGAYQFLQSTGYYNRLRFFFIHDKNVIYKGHPKLTSFRLIIIKE